MIALIDMDNTLCDYRGSLDEQLKKELELYKDLSTSGDPELERELALRIRRTPGFYRNLPKLELGFKVAKMLEEMKFDLHILTKGPYKTASAWTEKVEWCREYLPDVPVTITENKSLVYGKILFDDWPAYCEGWLKNRPRGLVIMPAYDYNEEFAKKYPDQVFRVTENNLDELKEVLIKKFGR